MGRMLEPGIYRRIEWNLHNVSALKKAESDIISNALHGVGRMSDPGTPKGGSKHSDPTAAKAITLTDNKTRQWLEVIDATYAYFDNYTPEGRAARLYYGKKTNNGFVAEKMQCVGRTVKVYRDDFVFRCAMYAVERGLIRLTRSRKGM